MIAAFAIAMICIHALQFAFLLDGYLYERRRGAERTASRWQVIGMLVDLAVVGWAAFILVTHA